VTAAPGPEPTVTLVLGGTRSGKSAVAERLTAETERTWGCAVTYVATASVHDDEMAQRVMAHRARRPPSWATVELQQAEQLPAVLLGIEGAVLLDSLGAWLASSPEMVVDAGSLGAALRSRPGPTVVVSEEVGLAVHPTTSAGRAFTDALGSLNQAIAAAADRAVLVVAGRILEL
jgi:adenosyl cobinamide kinase/adenosyl cobinamide phosphate guanylyltransferase